jgi:alanine racemase
MIEHDISVPAYCSEWVDAVLANHPAGLKVHMKVDTGMNRIGFKNNDDLKSAFDRLKEAGCVMEGIFTHFCCADFDEVFTNMQYDRFREAVEMLDYPLEWIHCDNSDATVWFKDDLSNACRIGISIYGINTYTDELRHPVSLHTTVTMVKKIKAGEKIGYGSTYTAMKDEIIATLPIGYADGFIRANKGRKVWCDGMFCEVVGNICMDQCMIDVTDLPVRVGDTVTLFGDNPKQLAALARQANTIEYECLCLISARVPRICRDLNPQTDPSTP